MPKLPLGTGLSLHGKTRNAAEKRQIVFGNEKEENATHPPSDQQTPVARTDPMFVVSPLSHT